MTKLRRPPILLDIIEEHFAELGFLREQRERVIFAPDWTLADLADLEARADAHLDGLRVGSAHSVDLARPALQGEDASAATAATLTMMSLSPAALGAEVIVALAHAASESARTGVRLGLRHSDISGVADRLTEVASRGEPAGRAAAADVLAFHRRKPPGAMGDLLRSDLAGVRRLACVAAGRFGGPWSADNLEAALSGDDGDLRRAALRTSARLGLPNLPALCRRAAGTPAPAAADALVFLGILGDRADWDLIASASRRPPLAAAGLEALGAFGDIRAVPMLVECMRNEALARAAGAAFVRITGAEGIAADQPSPLPADLSEDQRDFADDTRPPDAAKASAWWAGEQKRFDPAGRWQCGREVSKEPLGAGFDELALQVRRDLYLAVRARDAARTPDFELEGAAGRQRLGG